MKKSQSKPLQSALMIGQVMHQRLHPFQYHFRYHVMSVLVDIDELDTLHNNLGWLSVDRFNLFSLYTADHGSRDGQSWRQWANQMFYQYGLSTPPHRIELLCIPRFLGYSFNPMATWYAYDENNHLIGVIAEVSNTFKQWHHYVLSNQGAPLPDSFKATAAKVFHVSPFMGMDCQYYFRFAKPSEHLKITINETEHQRPALKAVQVGKRTPLNNANLLTSAIKLPFNAFKVIVLIHWWALKIWWKGGQFRSTPAHLKHIQHSHTEMEIC